MLCLAGLLAVVAVAAGSADHMHGLPRHKQPGWEPYLGRFAFNITTRSQEAQKLFQIGLLLLYNYDQPNARAAFRAALEADASCAMCAWGVAHSFGPTINAPSKGPGDMASGLVAARNASAALAVRRAGHRTKEWVLIDAMLARYPEDPHGDQVASYGRYAARLRELRQAGAEARADADLMVFNAEAMMVLMCDDAGYHFYDSRGDDLPPVPRPATEEVTRLLRSALVATNQTHPYAQHLMIHITEMSNAQAETAVEVATQLMKNMEGLQDQHLQHMTGHTFLRTGRYHEAVVGNEVAAASDAAYMHHGLVPYGPAHNSAFLVCAALWGGERAVAYRHAHRLRDILADAPGRPDAPDGSVAWNLAMQVPLRFGDWDRVQQLDATPPGDFAERWPYGHGVVRHFSLAVADVRLGRLAAGREHLLWLEVLLPAVAATGDVALVSLSAIANHTAAAVLARARGDLNASTDALRRAVNAEMSMTYCEPPPWPLPTRECYGQSLLDVGRPADAEKTFREALNGFSFHAEPRCGWALAGLRESLRRQPATEDRTRELEALEKQIAAVWRHADVPLASPCPLLGPEPRVFV